MRYPLAMRNYDLAMEPWDDAAMRADLLAVVDGLPRVRLDRTLPPPMPGAYLQFLRSERPQVVDAVGALIAEGKVSCYQGSAAQSLRARLGRYRQSLHGLRDIDVSDVHVAVLPCSTTASALFAERVLIDEFGGVFNRLGGWGAKVPGSHRSGQQSSALDALFGGRSWTQEPSISDTIRARAAVIAYLAQLDPGGRRWPSLFD